MPRSMTGFARLEAPITNGHVACEVRSVNHRYLEHHFRLPETLRDLEPALRDLVRKHVTRGKLELNIQLQFNKEASQLTINTERVHEISAAIEKIRDALTDAAAVNPLEVLQWPGVMQQQEVDTDALKEQVLQTINQTLQQLVAHREREGQEVAQHIEQRLEGIGLQVAEVRKLMPQIISNHRQKLTDKLNSLVQDVDPERLEQEMVYLIQKSDVDEELDRLDTHIKEVKHSLKQKGAIGRRLDFLMQELNREANTLSSKSIVSETTQAAVEIKVMIEQMREQIQNIE